MPVCQFWGAGIQRSGAPVLGDNIPVLGDNLQVLTTTSKFASLPVLGSGGGVKVRCSSIGGQHTSFGGQLTSFDHNIKACQFASFGVGGGVQGQGLPFLGTTYQFWGTTYKF